MNQVQIMSQDLDCTHIPVKGDYGTIFPEIEKILFSSTDFQEALSEVLPKAAADFTSLVDWILVEADRDYAPDWYKWRHEDGPALRDVPGFNEYKRLRVEKKMRLLIGAAYIMWKRNNLRSWKSVYCSYCKKVKAA